MAKSLMERASALTEATERLRLAGEEWTAKKDGDDFARVAAARELSDRAVRYTQAMQAFAKGGAE